jgi:hypothetical protein
MHRTVPRKVSEFLTQRQGRNYCDICIQERLGLKWRQQVQLITATLACTEVFTRDLGACCICNETKQVISAKGTALQMPSAVTERMPSAVTEKISSFSRPLMTASRAQRKI